MQPGRVDGDRLELAGLESESLVAGWCLAEHGVLGIHVAGRAANLVAELDGQIAPVVDCLLSGSSATVMDVASVPQTGRHRFPCSCTHRVVQSESRTSLRSWRSFSSIQRRCHMWLFLDRVLFRCWAVAGCSALLSVTQARPQEPFVRPVAVLWPEQAMSRCAYARILVNTSTLFCASLPQVVECC